MSDVFASFALERLVGVVPRFIARRIAPPQVVKSELSIGFRNQGSVDLQLGRSVPLLRFWLSVDNRSRIDVVLDRAIVELWVGQPLLRGAILTRAEIRSRQRYDDLPFETYLTTEQVSEIRQQQQVPAQNRQRLRLHIQSWYETRVGWIEVIDVAERDLPV